MHTPESPETREMLPASSLALAIGFAVWSAAHALFASPWPALAAVLVFGVFATVALGQHARRRPRPRFGVPNGITLARTGLIALTAAFAAAPPPTAAPAWWAAAAAAGMALLLDGVDGWVARRTARQSAFGARFDMETDALAALVLCVVLWRADRTGLWIVTIGALRYIFVFAGWTFAWMRRPLPPSQRRRVICAAQGALLVAGLFPFLPPAVPAVLGGFALVLTAGSFLADTAWLWRRRAPVL